MNAQEFIGAVETEASHFWKNVDLDELTIKLMVDVATHYKKCAECRQAFNEMEYDEQELVELESMFNEHSDISEWVCGGDE